MSYPYTPLALAALWITLTGIYLKRRNKPPTFPLPPSPKPDFLIGNLRAVPSSSNEAKVYQQWSKEFGSDIVSANVPGQVIVVLNSLEAATELLTKRSAIYSDRAQLPMLCNENLLVISTCHFVD
ncbi:hypothetical protein BDV93DRAFT_566965 [Ceratobasidium sp. AG-I]|nr:hypothetical protein BDV93DRAFT_566965 [Ceratobasidium sp. AG-I]